MKVKKKVKERIVKETIYKIELTKEEVGSLIYLLDEVKGDWYYDDNTINILSKLKEVKKCKNK